MSFSLSQLFEQSKSQNSPQKEESRDENRNEGIDNGSIDRFLLDSEQNNANVTSRKSKKRRRPPSPSNIDNESGGGGDGGDDNHKREARIKEEPSNDVKNDAETVKEEGVENSEEEEEFDEEDETVDRASNHKFYQNYSQSVQVLYNTSKENGGLESNKKALEVVNSALHPSNKKSGANERRLPGDYDMDGKANTFPSRSLAGRYRPRKKRVLTKIASRKHEVSYRLETQEEIQERVKRMEGYTEREKIRRRWKFRTVNFQEEQDIGDAFWVRAQETIGEKLRSDERERLQRKRKAQKEGLKRKKKEELKKIKELERNDQLEEDDEVKEQSQLLAQLSQPEFKQEMDPTTNLESNEPAQKVNYWELGYAMPNKSSITFDYDPPVEKMVQSGIQGAFQTIQNEKENKDETKGSFSALMVKVDGPRNSARYFFEPNRALISNSKGTFRPGHRTGHIHHLLSMAARSLCGDGGSRSMEDIELENQYIRLLCKQHEDEFKKHQHFDATICAGFRKKVFLTKFAEDQGQNMLLYLQNAWDDPAEVAKQLGIMDSYQESPMRGNLLTTISAHSKTKRLRIKKSHKVRKTDWDFENHEDNEDESDHEDGKEETTIPLDVKVLPEVPTIGGVVDAMTLETSMSLYKKKYFGNFHDDRDALIAPTTFYSHIVGTSPPIPQHPLDPAAWMFGPVDRFSKFYHTSVRMDASIYKIVLSTLVKRIARARISKNHFISRKTQEQIMNLIEEFASINENKLYLQYTNTVQDPSDSDIPLVEFYRGINGYCSYMANGFLETHEAKNEYDEEEMSDLKNEDGESQRSSEMNLIAGKIWEFCQPKIRQNALLRFPKLRIVFGVALICRSINPSAAEILSSPMDDDSIRTPLDLFKEALEDMESKKYITANRNLEDNSIRAVELEFLLHDAAEFFQEAVELDPTNVEYQLWHVGCLASCLLISSGNKICSKTAHVHPSQMKGTFMDSVRCVHEVRPCMKKYDEVRVELSTAVRALFTLVKYQDSSRAHFGLFSFLEWGQVIGLLVGSKLEKFLNDIHKHHAFHFGGWARKDPTAFLREYKGITENICVASLYAQILENDPGKIANWRNFAICLGPISVAKSDDWWGKDRAWWADSLLHTVTTNTCDREMIDGLMQNNLLGKLIEAIVTSSNEQELQASIRLYNKKLEKMKERKICEKERKIREYEPMLEDDDQAMDWLPTLETVMVKNEEQVDISEEQRTRCYADELPKMQKNVSDDNDNNNPASAFLSSISMSSADNPTLKLSSLSTEVEAYKFFISCHLFGVEQPSVREYISSKLFSYCVRNNSAKVVDENCDEFRVLLWLNLMGIDIEDIIHGIESAHGK